MSLRHFSTTAALMVASCLLTTSSAYAFGKDDPIWSGAERLSNIPAILLYGIALVESGTTQNGRFEPYQWTLNINASPPRSTRYASRAEAAQALQALLDQGIRNVDVGMMQVNVRYHGHSVSNPVDLLDPKTNVLVAASYLTELWSETRDVHQTIAYYHSRTPKRGQAYKNKVLDRIILALGEMR